MQERGPGKNELRAEVVAALRRNITPAEYRAIRKLWIAHSAAEDARDIPSLMATLTEDCVYTIGNDGATWYGKAGATRFYEELLGAFPDIHFDLQNIVIGPQGVYEEALVTATYRTQWLNMPPPDGQTVKFTVTIFFPWDPAQKLFSGERVFFHLH